MVVFGALASAAACTQAVFLYNRKNYLFDRKLRQEQEFTVLEYRNAQLEQWREDIRQLMDMTEKKMDKYTVITCLMLDMCIGMFAEGRLEPGVPPWVLLFYMLTLGGAFMYLLMSTWFAIHASVIANCTSVRLLTQFVRLPIPTWKELEDMRTYGSSYESVKMSHLLRVPFTGKAGRVQRVEEGNEEEEEEEEASAPPERRGSASKAPSNACCDPWDLEQHGFLRGFEELHAEHPALRRHVGLARTAMRQFQAYDAIARLSMNFGVQQMLGAIAYYCIGYAGVQDGATLPAWAIAAIMGAAVGAFITVDFALTTRERITTEFLALLGPLCCASCATAWTLSLEGSELVLRVLLPTVCSAHALLLGTSLWRSGLQAQLHGVVIPTRFRAVLYLDVFGWFQTPPVSRSSSRDLLTTVSRTASRAEAERAAAASGSPPPRRPFSKAVRNAPPSAFSPATYSPAASRADRPSPTDQVQPGSFPARTFRKGTWLLICLWSLGLLMGHEEVLRFMSKPVGGRSFLEDASGRVIHYETAAYLPVSVHHSHRHMPHFPTGHKMQVEWPFRGGFFPHMLGADSFGKQLVVVNDLGMYSGNLHGRTIKNNFIERAHKAADFKRMLPCTALQGHHRADFSITCAPQSVDDETKVCFIFVLDEGGQRLVQCPPPPEMALGNHNRSQASVQPVQSWNIASHWLHKEEWDEHVTSMAVSGNCFHAGVKPGVYKFDAGGHGCVIVGTSIGRIIQMMGSSNNGHTLVPMRSLYRGGQTVARGTLQILLSGFLVALRRKDPERGQEHATIQAFHTGDGSLAGEWKLPDSASWLTFTGAGNALFALGLQNHDHMALHAFPVPDQLLVVKQFSG